MRSVKTVILGIVLASFALEARAQDAAGAANQVRKSAEQAAAQSNKPAGQAPAKPAAPAPAKAGSAAGAQNKPAAPGTPSGKPATAPAQAAKPATPQGKPTTPPAKALAGTKPPAKARSASAAKKATPKKPAVKRAAKPATPAQNAQATLDKQTRVARRDPFEAMLGRETSTAMVGNKTLPPGKAGLQVSTLRLDGVVRAPNGMIAVVSNPQSRTYFLREGDQLYDGRVEKIAMDGVSFHEVGQDAFGKPVERQVNKRIYASAGEQQ